MRTNSRRVSPDPVTSPPKRITILCPSCGSEYTDWHRPSINRDLEAFSDEYIAEAGSATCPGCEHRVEVSALVVEDDVWRYRPSG